MEVAAAVINGVVELVTETMVPMEKISVGIDNGVLGWGTAPKRSSSQSQAGNGWSGSSLAVVGYITSSNPSLFRVSSKCFDIT